MYLFNMENKQLKAGKQQIFPKISKADFNDFGGIKIGFEENQENHNYPVLLNNEGQAFVHISNINSQSNFTGTIAVYQIITFSHIPSAEELETKRRELQEDLNRNKTNYKQLGWAESVGSINDSNTQYLFQATCFIEKNNYKEWQVIRTNGMPGTNGEDGKDGYSYKSEYIYSNSELAIESHPENWEISQDDKYIKEEYSNIWSFDPVSVNENNPNAYVSVRSTVNGKWQKYSTPILWAHYGKDGENGVTKQGLTGCVIRMRGKYSDSAQYYNDSNILDLPDTELRYIDVVLYHDPAWPNSNPITYKHFIPDPSQITKEHRTITNILPTNRNYWIESADFDLAYINTLISDQIYANTIDTSEIRIKGTGGDYENKIVAGITGGSQYKYQGDEKIEENIQKGSVRFWAGSDIDTTSSNAYQGDVTKAPFRVLQDGSLIADNASINGEIKAQTIKLVGENSSYMFIDNDDKVLPKATEDHQLVYLFTDNTDHIVKCKTGDSIKVIKANGNISNVTKLTLTKNSTYLIINDNNTTWLATKLNPEIVNGVLPCTYYYDKKLISTDGSEIYRRLEKLSTNPLLIEERTNQIVPDNISKPGGQITITCDFEKNDNGKVKLYILTDDRDYTDATEVPNLTLENDPADPKLLYEINTNNIEINPKFNSWPESLRDNRSKLSISQLQFKGGDIKIATNSTTGKTDYFKWVYSNYIQGEPADVKYYASISEITILYQIEFDAEPIMQETIVLNNDTIIDSDGRIVGESITTDSVTEFKNYSNDPIVVQNSSTNLYTKILPKSKVLSTSTNLWKDDKNAVLNFTQSDYDAYEIQKDNESIELDRP